MNDIIPPRKSIRDIPLPEGRQQKTVEKEIQNVTKTAPRSEPKSEFRNEPKYELKKENSPDSSRKYLWIIAGALILGIGLSVFLLFSKATLAIVTKNQPLEVNISATSTKDGAEGTIPYSIITLQKEDSIDLVASTGTTQVKKKASGTITIFNNYSPDSQALIATTRFQTTDGKIFRIDKDITVPGQTTQNGQTVPGSIDAVVYADQPGDTYNISKTDFTIPGFQGSPKAQGFSAKSKTDITGGYIGAESIVTPQEISAKDAALKDKINKELMDQVGTQTPDTFIFFKEGLVLDYSTSTETQDNKSVLKGRGVGLALIFNKKLLADEINKENNTKYSALEGWENLQATISNTKGLTTGDFPAINLALKGTMNIGQEINIGELQRALAGKSKNDLNQILSAYPSVSSANAKIRPFWKSSFPNDAQKITITLTKEQ